MSYPFILLFRYFQKKKWAVIISVFVLCSLSIFFATRIHFTEDISRILPADASYDEINHIFEESKFLERIVVHIYSDSTSNEESLQNTCDSFVSFLQQDKFKNTYHHIEYQVSDDAMYEVYQIILNNLPLFLDENDYSIIEKRIEAQAIKKQMESNYKLLTSPSGFAVKTAITDDPLHFAPIVFEKLKRFQIDDKFQLSNGYIMSADKNHLLLFIHPNEKSTNTGTNEKLINNIESAIQKANSNNNNSIHIEYFGGSAVSVANAKQIKKDILFTTILAIILLYVFISYYFRNFGIFFLLFLPIVIGTTISLGLIYFISGTISSISLGVGSVLLGIAINLSLHIFTHFKQHRDIEEVIQDITTPSIVTALTTSCAFFCLLFLDSDAMKDLGLFAGISILITTICSLVITPHILHWQKNISQQQTWIDTIASYPYHNNKWIILAILLVFSISIYFMNNVKFEDDMNQMSYVPEHLKKAENNLDALTNYKLKNIFLISNGQSLNEALDKSNVAIPMIDSLMHKGIIAKYTNVSTILNSEAEQKKRIQKWNQFWNQHRSSTNQSVQFEASKLGFTYEAFQPFYSMLSKTYQPLSKNDERILRSSFVNDYIIESKSSNTVVTLLKVKQENKAAVYNAFKGDSRYILVDRQYLADTFVSILKNNFNLLLYLSFGIVFIIILLSFGRIELTLLCVLPMMVSWCITLGVMAIFNIKFTIFNIIISTFIFGMGDDFSVFLVNGLQQKYSIGKDNVRSYKTSILLATITTLIGIGVLILSKHPAMRSIAAISIIGILSVVTVSYTIQPLLFNIFIQNRKDKAKLPLTFRDALMSIYAFGYFFVGCIVLSIFGLLTVVPFGRFKKVRYMYHWCISKYAKSLVDTVFTMKKCYINEPNEDFNKPAVIIANHSSFVDILVILGLHPKIIMLTNDWVYNKSPFSIIVRLAGFYHVKEGHEQSEAVLRKKIEEGYHVMAFPEGTRSNNQNKLGRFHKGIFYIAEQFNLDIIPVVLHGIGHANHKSEFIQKPGQSTIKILPRIKPDDLRFGENYAQRTPRIAKYFKDEFELLRQQIEQGSYFYDRVLKNYALKAPMWLEWYVRVKLRVSNSYTELLKLLPRNTPIYDLGCGYGYIALLAHQMEPDRKIIGIDFDEDKIQIASNLNTKNENLTFISQDVKEFIPQFKASFIISDVLHYLTIQDQFKLLQCCIDNLDDNGVLIIREANSDSDKHTQSQWTEKISTFIGFNNASYEQMEFISEKELRNFFESKNLNFSISTISGNTSNQLYYISKP